MITYKEQRVAVFVDVQNMYYSAKNLFDSKVNFGKILETAVNDRKVIRAIAYCIRAEAPEEQSFFEALAKQGYEVKMKDLQVYYGGNKKGDWDVGIAMDATKLASRVDTIVLVSGDGDFLPLVSYLQSHGVMVEVMAFRKSASTKLVEATDAFIDLGSDPKRYLLARSGTIRRLVPGPLRPRPPEQPSQ